MYRVKGLGRDLDYSFVSLFLSTVRLSVAELK